MTQLKLYFLGPPRLERDGQIVEPDTRKATALLAYLAVMGERPSREALAALLWPEFDDSRAKAALRRTLSALKATVGSQSIYATREIIGLEMEHVWCDVARFHQALAAAATHLHENKSLCPECQDYLETAVAFYRDDFLSGFSLRDSLPFDEWQLHQAEQLRRSLSDALELLVQNASRHQNFDSGIGLARRWLQLDPLREEAHCQLMRLYAWAGQRNSALLQYRAFVRFLDDELGVPPLSETTELYHDIQNGRVNQPATLPPAPIVLPRNTPSPLIGRDAELGQMQQLYQQVGPDGRLLIVAGEPGIGKTRLAETLLAWTATAGASALTGRCYEGETNLAYAPIIQALQNGLAQATATAQLDALPPHYLAEAARLLPQLAAGRSLPTLAALNAPGEQVRFFEGIAQTLTALLIGPTPGVFWLDDVHWLDSASQEFLLYLLHRWQKRPFLILLCWRTEELPPAHTLLPLIASLHRSGVSHTINPMRFTLDHVQALLNVSDVAYPTDLPGRLFAETEGLPFFVVEYLNALAEDAELLAAEATLTIPVSVRDLLHNRLIRIGETERQILQTAAIIGHSFDLGLVQAGSGRSADEAVTALEMLTLRGLLVDQTAVYNFSHNKLRALVYEEMGLARRRLLHRRMANILAQQQSAMTAAVAAQIASHYQFAGQEGDAAAYFIQAGDQARSLFAHQDAIHHYRSALALGADEAWRLHAACGELQMRLGAYPNALSSFETAAALAPVTELGNLEHQLGQVYQRQGSWSLAAHTLEQAQEHLLETADPANLAHLIIDRSLVAHRQKQPDEALALAQQARALAESAADQAMQALAYNILGLLARSRGELETAVIFLEQSRRLATSSNRPDILIAAHNNLALTHSATGKIGVAQENLERALVLCQHLGDRHQEAALRSNLADLLHQLGKETAAREQIKQSVTIYAEIGREEDTWHAEIWQLTEW
jgi:DNA-binding SARP family transcriptional activator/predicted ATPase